ncbi:MAG: electron transfer flavoprotein subunit alpha/FixB family protein [Gemmatimonadota bacterium]|nr:electron transfer flavoprotein subunit alpha/FixB family protein [Gemmatimonadota bacterium]MDH3422475.1 electron transfer flavoprotein subunit alpha/FixB family protein [Gemmatimonadota bacterium]
MPNVLVIAETRDGKVTGASREVTSLAAGVAKSLGGHAEALLLGDVGASSEAGGLGRFGAATIAVAEHEALASYQPEAYAQVVVSHVRAGDYSAVLLPATTLGKDLAPRVAALLDVPLATDATGLEVDGGTVVVERPVYAGKAFARLEIEATPVLVSIRPNVFSATETDAEGAVSTFTPDVDPSTWKVKVLERLQATGGTTDVAEASIIVSGGRGMKDPSNWNLLEGLRDAMGSGAALGASRAVVDAGWRPHSDQVGQTGKTVAPTLYIAIGISGAIQHLAGMRTSKTIVAINKDPSAPIFNVADYGIVGDLFEVVPRLTEEISALKAGD